MTLTYLYIAPPYTEQHESDRQMGPPVDENQTSVLIQTIWKCWNKPCDGYDPGVDKLLSCFLYIRIMIALVYSRDPDSFEA